MGGLSVGVYCSACAMCALRPAVSANFSAALVAAIASGVIGLAMMFSKLFNHVFSRELGVVAGAA